MAKALSFVRVVVVLCLCCFVSFSSFNTYDGLSLEIPCSTVLSSSTTASSSTAAWWQLNRQAIRQNYARYTMEELQPVYQRWTMATVPHQTLVVQAIQRINGDDTATKNNNKDGNKDDNKDDNGKNTSFVVEGAIVEVGVWKGGLSMAMMLQNQRYNVDREFWLFDTFDGLPPPDQDKNGALVKDIWTAHQGTAVGGRVKHMVNNWKQTHTIEEGKMAWGPLDVVKNNVYFTGYPPENIHFVTGKVEDTLPRMAAQHQLPEKIALLRIDTDWYESTKAELEYLYDRLQPGGVLIVDDYCFLQGAADAVREYFQTRLHLNADQIKQDAPCFHYWKPLQ